MPNTMTDDEIRSIRLDAMKRRDTATEILCEHALGLGRVGRTPEGRAAARATLAAR